MSTVELERPRASNYKLKVIDCDIHPAMTFLYPGASYLERQWIEHLTVYGSHLRHAFSEALIRACRRRCADRCLSGGGRAAGIEPLT